MATIVIDLDGTLTIDTPGVNYADLSPNKAVVEKIREYHDQGFKIAIYTSRNMRTHENSVGRINAFTLPLIIEWLKFHNIPFDEVHVGKPWAEEGGFYVDDRAIRPDEFIRMTHSEIMTITGAALQ